MNSSVIFQHIFNGIAQGCTYSLIAIGYAMIMSALRKMNFCHSDVYMFGAMIAYTVLGFFCASVENMFIIIGVGLIAGMLSSACVGWGIEKIAFKKLRFAPSMANSLCTIGCGYFLKEGVRLIWGGENQRFGPNYSWVKSYELGHLGITVTNLQLVMFVTAVGLIIVLQMFLYWTATGKAIRAISIDMKAAQLMGIDLDRISSITFMISSALSGAAGVLVGFYYRTCSPYMGATPGTKAFAAIVLGGLTSIPGAAVGGVMLGVAENVGGLFTGDSWRDVFAYAMLFFILIIRPQGLMGGNKLEG